MKTIPAELDACRELLKGHGMTVEYQRATDQIYLTFKILEQDFPLFIKIHENLDWLQLLIFVPLALKDERFAELARLLHYLNKEIELPGFCLDEAHNVIFYRLMLPISDNQIEAELFIKSIQGCKEACDQVISTIIAINNGTMGAEQLMTRLEKAKAKKQRSSSSSSS